VGYVIAGVIVVVILLWMFTRGGKYKQIFADTHLLEVGQKIAAMRAAALAQADRDEGDARPMDPDDPRHIISSAGLTLIYTIMRDGDFYVHHLSLSNSGGGYTPHAVGDMFIRWGLLLLEVDPTNCELLISPRTVHYAIWRVTSEQQSEFGSRAIVEPTEEMLAAFRQSWRETPMKYQWQHFTPGH
jgi:hypothetical protein